MGKYKEAILYIAFILLIFIFVVSKTYPLIVNVITLETNIHKSSTQLSDAQKRLQSLKDEEAAKLTLSGQLKTIYKADLPSADVESSFTVIFDDIIDMAKYNGIKIYSIEYQYNPPEDEFIKGSQGRYNVCQVNMQIIVDYQDLDGFLQEIYKYPYLVNILKLEMVPYPKNKKILLTTLQLKLYSEK